MGSRLSKSSRTLVKYGGGSPAWSSSAKLLGVQIDNNLDFCPMLESVYSRLNSSSWRVFNHSDLSTGASPRTLEIVFFSWLLPIIEYGSPVWIFRLREPFHYSSPIASKYNVVFGKIESLYHRLAKSILGVDRSTSNNATLVRLGWMPLDYFLAYRACIWYMKIRLGLAGNALKDQLSRLSNPRCDELWAKTYFYKPAHDMIHRLEPKLLDLQCISEFKGRLRDLFFDELTERWRACSHAPICHVIHPEWRPVCWTRMIFSRQTCSSYHQIAVGRGKFGDRLRYSGRGAISNNNCRFGCNITEDVYHLFFDCVYCSSDILTLQNLCARKRLDYSLKNLFYCECLQPRVELFLKKIFSF